MATLAISNRPTLRFAHFYRPLSARTLALVSLAVVLGNALYCLAFNWTQGKEESALEAVGWGVANLLPWLFAFEIGKRWIDDPEEFPVAVALRFSLLILLAVSVSLGLEWVFAGLPDWSAPGELSFQFLRRVPGIVVLTGLLLARRPIESQARDAGIADTGPGEPPMIPFLPGQILWIKAAGNYLEFRADGRTSLCRMTMKQAEQLLERDGFLRVHRSALVNVSRIIQVRPGKLYDEVQLIDGTWVRVGGAYRTRVAQYRSQLVR